MQVKGIDIVYGQNWVEQYRRERYRSCNESTIKMKTAWDIMWNCHWRDEYERPMCLRHANFIEQKGEYIITR